MTVPFVVLGTPRSATFWLSQLLSSDDAACAHEPSRRWRNRGELLGFLRASASGAVDSMLTLHWRAVAQMAPSARVVVIRRPVEEVLHSFVRVGLWHPRLPALVRLIDARAAEACAGMTALCVPYADLRYRETCDHIFWWCRGVHMPQARWQALGGVHLQADLGVAIDEAVANAAGVRAVFPDLAMLEAA